MYYGNGEKGEYKRCLLASRLGGAGVGEGVSGGNDINKKRKQKQTNKITSKSRDDQKLGMTQLFRRVRAQR